MNNAFTNNGQKREPQNVFIAAETREEAERLAERIRSASDYNVIGIATDRIRMEEAISGFMPVDALITDIALNGEDVTPLFAKARQFNENIDILVYTTNTQDNAVIRAVLAGAMGYLLKGDQEDILTSMRLMRGGGSPVSPTVTRSVLKALQSRSNSPTLRAKKKDSTEIAPLSQREAEILALLAKGISFADIGDILSISPHTVTAHIKKIYRKLQVHSRGEAVYEAACMGILPDQHMLS
ncbi:response regulator transcription factor [Sutterella massiliensis]|uniref:Response regulator transcription factor n=1 Tax=Sutterella massiliensis TaxID=1816689 RepID=A0ABS2DQB0_9BURK|nr:response regulator transcription factor [Sutterella massiliensis]MBM6702910.1 response regulator transcription factor [Sutterella massiliensis]